MSRIKLETPVVVIFKGGNGYCGCNFEEVVHLEYDDELDPIYLSEYGNDLCVDNAETYSAVHFGWDYDNADNEEWDDYLEGCWFDYEILTLEMYENER